MFANRLQCALNYMHYVHLPRAPSRCCGPHSPCGLTWPPMLLAPRPVWVRQVVKVPAPCIFFGHSPFTFTWGWCVCLYVFGLCRFTFLLVLSHVWCACSYKINIQHRKIKYRPLSKADSVYHVSVGPSYDSEFRVQVSEKNLQGPSTSTMI